MRRALAILVVALALALLYVSQLYEYLLFHSLAELFSIVIGCGIFVIAWNTRAFLRNDYLRLLGIACLFVAGLDLAHMLSYSGMAIFRGYDANLPTQLWIAARSLESVSLLVAPLLLHRAARGEILLLAYAGVTLFLVLSIFIWRVFPDCYIEGEGLTAFKRAAEYVICVILLGAIVLLLSKREDFDRQVLRLLVWSLTIAIVSELAFTSYISVFGPMNFVGHVLKILSIYLVYKAIIETGLAKPYALLLREEKLAEAELERQVRERTATLQATTDQLNSFVYSIAHDLRAPLRAQHGFAAILLEEHGQALGTEGRVWVEKIAGSARRMDELVSGLLHYATISSEKPPLSRLRLRDIVERVRRGMQRQAQESEATMDIAAVHGEVMAHEESVELAVQHLLSNALKFRRPGEPARVKLWTEHRDGNLRLWVQDNGIGIPPQYRDKVFGVFQRLHTNAEYPGTGIGLALVRKSIERLGGTVGFESEPGQGSRFWLELKSAE